MSIAESLISYHENLYREYINNHKLNVQKAWETMKNNKNCIDFITKNLVNMDINAAIALIDELIKNHDSSKFSTEEFDAYRKNFYPISEEEKESNKEAFELAWRHHYTNNLHHWNWWAESGNMNNMSFVHIIEMICDWEAMGYKFGNNSKEFYEQNKHKIQLGEKQRIFAENLMNMICL